MLYSDVQMFRAQVNGLLYLSICYKRIYLKNGLLQYFPQP